MIDKNFYSIRDISNVLNIPESTVRYWRNQFTNWIPSSGRGRNRRYPKDSIEVFRFIEQCRNNNMTVDGINDALSHEFPIVIDIKQGAERKPVAVQQQTVLSNKTLPVLIDLLEGLLERQQRIADAEERKAKALEDRADTEKIKATALQGIAQALEKIACKENGTVNSVKSVIVETIPKAVNEIINQNINEETTTQKYEARPGKKRTSNRPDDKYIEVMLKTIERLRDKQRLSFTDIANKLNSESLPTFAGEGLWDQHMIVNMYQWLKGK